MSRVLIYLTAILAFVSLSTCMPNPEHGVFLGTIDRVVNGAPLKKLVHLSTTPLSYPEALVYCKRVHNGQLLAILNAAEDEFVHDSLILNSIDAAWTSGIYENGWRWGAGPLMTYYNFGSGYPGSTTYGVYVYASGLQTYEWRTSHKTIRRFSFCESV